MDYGLNNFAYSTASIKWGGPLRRLVLHPRCEAAASLILMLPAVKNAHCLQKDENNRGLNSNIRSREF